MGSALALALAGSAGLGTIGALRVWAREQGRAEERGQGRTEERS
ncbi:hypothetical protein [Streptomyces sp. NEAU-H3]|nr:hypothetical protein [Streptomyces sp. NEAU-H3]